MNWNSNFQVVYIIMRKEEQSAIQTISITASVPETFETSNAEPASFSLTMFVLKVHSCKFSYVIHPLLTVSW